MYRTPDDVTFTVYAPMYYDATKSDHAEATKCFGLLYYVAFMNRPENWYVGKFKLNGKAIGSNTWIQPVSQRHPTRGILNNTQQHRACARYLTNWLS